MRSLIFTTLLLIVFCWAPAGAEPPAMPYDGLEEFVAFVREVKQKIAVERVYQIGSQEELTLAPGQAARLSFTDNPAGVTEFLLFYDNEIVHVIYRCAGDTDRQYDSTSLYAERLTDSRSIRAEGAGVYLKVCTEWEPKDKQALVRFRAELPSEDELRGFRKGQEEQRKERERMEALRRQAAAVREWDLEEQTGPFTILMDALARKAAGLRIRLASGGDEENYVRWILPYLYYLSFDLDQRFYAKDHDGQGYAPPHSRMMLVPKGAKRPRYFKEVPQYATARMPRIPGPFIHRCANEEVRAHAGRKA